MPVNTKGHSKKPVSSYNSGKAVGLQGGGQSQVKSGNVANTSNPKGMVPKKMGSMKRSLAAQGHVSPKVGK